MKRFASLVFVFIAVLAFSSFVSAKDIYINSQTLFESLLSVGSSDWYGFVLSEPELHYFSVGGSGSTLELFVGINNSTGLRDLRIDSSLIVLDVVGGSSNVSALKTRYLFLDDNGGVIKATGGTGNNAPGISVRNSLTQKNGSIFATGGTGINSGIYIYENLSQDGGYISAIGGAGNMAYGIFAKNGVRIGGKLSIARINSAASILVTAGDEPSTDGYFAMTDGSILNPVVDLSKSESIASGLVQAPRIIRIYEGVTLELTFENTYKLEKDDTFNGVVFLSTDGAINGTFENEEGSTITLSYEAAVSSDNKEYALNIERTKTPQEAFEDGNAPNAYTVLVGDIYDTLTNSSAADTYEFLIKLLDNIDNSITVDAAMNAIDDSISVIKPVSYWNDIAKRDFTNGLISLDSKMDDFSNENNKYWIDIPFAIGKMGGETETTYGAAVGYAGIIGDLSYAAQINGSYGTIGGESQISNRMNFGIQGIVAYTFHVNDLLNPKASINLGFNHGDIGGGMASQNAFIVGLNVSNKFSVLNMITIEPVIGVNYSMIKVGAFTYSGTPTSIDLSDTTLNSLAASLRVKIGYNVSESFSISANGLFSFDILKNDSSTFDYDLEEYSEIFAVFNAINDGGSRLTFGGGLNLSYKLPSNMSIDASYQIYVHGKDMSHQIKAGVNMTF